MSSGTVPLCHHFLVLSCIHYKINSDNQFAIRTQRHLTRQYSAYIISADRDITTASATSRMPYALHIKVSSQYKIHVKADPSNDMDMIVYVRKFHRDCPQ